MREEQPAAAKPGRRLQLRHLFVALAGAAVLFAVLAALVRESTTKVQLSAFGQSVILVLMIVASIGFIFYSRQRVEQQAGATIERFGRTAGKILHWVALTALVASCVVPAVAEWYKAKPGEVVNLLPSPFILFMVVNYAVVRVWWKIDPLALEACENGLVQGGWHFLRWSDINRYTWSGKSSRQLNLFLNNLTVVHVRADASFADQLDKLVAKHTKTAAPAGARSA